MENELFVYCDGGCRGNPGRGAIGVLVTNASGEHLTVYSSTIGETTNNRAEYEALIKGLDLARVLGYKGVTCFSDSELVVNQASGKFKVRNKKLVQLFLVLKSKEANFERVNYLLVPRAHKYIHVVDRLLNYILDVKDMEVL